MNILSEIEGLKGEELTSALLRVLLLRNPEFRTNFVKLLSSQSRQGPVSSESHFSCYLEDPTKDEEGIRGRIDLVIEMDDAVIGIENKLGASFQPGQPQRYLRTLKEKAKDLGGLRTRHDPSQYRSIIMLLAPDDRKPEIETHMATTGMDRSEYGLLWWSQITNLLDREETREKFDRKAAAIAEMLVEYLEDWLAFIPGYQDLVPHLLSRFSDKGTPEQRDFVGKVWQFFPESGRRISAGETWSGYYFGTESGDRLLGWYGFLAENRFKEEDQGVKFVIVTPYEVEPPPNSFTNVELTKPCLPPKPGKKKEHAWAVELKGMDQPRKWEETLKRVHEALAIARDEAVRNDQEPY